MPEVLVASVTVVFGGAAGPERIAEGLLAHDEVTTVRINPHGAASGYRVDVVADTYELAAERAAGLAGTVAAEVDAEAEVVSVGLVRDADRVEVFRLGERGDELVWGER